MTTAFPLHAQSKPGQWQRATWQDYVSLRDAPTTERNLHLIKGCYG
jgi:hypothetical protein